MAEMLLTIQHNGTVFSPPVEEGVQIEWERTGSPGKLTFTTVTPSSGSLVFTEGDPVCFYYDNKPVFMGYVFTKKHDREKKIQVTCYDQIRYLKNKFSYVFENKTATQIVNALCKDFNLQVGDMDNTNYVIPAIAEENKSALDIVLNVLEETLLNTGNMFVLYDDFGKLRLSNSANMTSLTLIYNESAENFDFSSSIDDETYNQVILYYKQNDTITQVYTASSPSTIKQWGTLRYFEEVKTPTIGQNKANSLLKLYNRKTRELKVNGAFGDISVRGGTLIPVQLELGETLANNFMLVEKVTHHFDADYHTMDLTLEGAWEDKETDVVSKTVGELMKESNDSSISSVSGVSNGSNQTTGLSPESTVIIADTYFVTIVQQGAYHKQGKITVNHYRDGKLNVTEVTEGKKTICCDKNSNVVIKIYKRTEGSGGGNTTGRPLDYVWKIYDVGLKATGNQWVNFDTSAKSDKSEPRILGYRALATEKESTFTVTWKDTYKDYGDW